MHRNSVSVDVMSVVINGVVKLLCALLHIHVLMRDEKEERKKQARSNKQQGKATQYTHMYMSLLKMSISFLYF